MTQAPFPYFGGKARIAAVVWDLLGDVPNYVEPFFGSGAVLLHRPHTPQLETVNDACGFICNVWRAIQEDPAAVASSADRPVNENDLHAIHSWLLAQRSPLTARLEGDMDYYDAKVAGLWLWGICGWIGGGWCSGQGPWQVVDGQLVRTAADGQGINRQRPHLGDAGQGINHRRPHLGDAGRGIKRKLPHLGSAGQGINHRRPHLGNAGMGVHAAQARDGGLLAWMQALCDRLRQVRVCCGDWTRVLGPSVTWKHGTTGVYLDPPYGHSERDPALYAIDQDATRAVEAWCLTHGGNPLLRIVLSGYEGEYTLPGWRVHAWKATAGYHYGTGSANPARERLWISPHCLQATQGDLFGWTCGA